MASLLDRLLGRTPTDAKAVTGPGAYAMTYYPSITAMSRHPNRLMLEAQNLYRAHPWVYRAESVIVEGCLSLPWHLEDEDGETIDDTSDETYRNVLKVIERPNPKQTRRRLWGITLRHMGVGGNGIHYLDQTADSAAPLNIYYINPVRMDPVQGPDESVKGWVMDGRDNPVTGGTGDGVPFQAAEIMHFVLNEPDWGVWGSGWIEATQRKLDLSKITDTYLAQVLGSGGRITGILSPKDERTSFTQDEFKQFANDWRRIVDDPNAAKRLQISQKPIELTQTSMSVRDLLLPDVSKLARDDIFAAAGVPLSQAGIATPAGLNSGEKGKYDEAALYQGAIIPRMEAFRETFQYQFLDRFELGLQLVIDYPEFDDRKPLFEMGDLAKVLPLTNDERRQHIGLDPLEDEEIGAQVWIASTMTRMDKEDEPQPAPILPPVPGTQEAATDEEAEVVEDVAKAKLNMAGIRTKADQAYTPRLKEAVRVALADQRSDVVRKLRKSAAHLASKASDTTVWWNEKRENDRLSRAILPILEDEARTVGSRVRSTLILPAMKAEPLSGVVEFVRQRAAERIQGINETTREAIAKAVETGVEEGLSAHDLAELIEDATSFNDARAELIARTETMLAYNDSALRTYSEYEVVQVQAIDGDHDAECAARDGNTYALDDAYQITDHPNGTLDWIPVVP